MSFAIFFRTSAMIESRRPACSLHFVNPHGLYDPSPNAYSHVAVATAPARIVFASGQGGEDQHGRLAPDFPGQVGGRWRISRSRCMRAARSCATWPSSRY